ncbi:MAG TPA: VCBS repeat-containing protein, partial [Gemmatimonadaceae bacterium]
LDDDRDGRLDLVVVGEWMPVRVFRQRDGRFVERTTEAGLAGTEGWWNSVTVADLNGDGHPDLVLGNLGRNADLHASPAEPTRLYVHDFGNTGTLKQVLTTYRHGVGYPIPGRDDLAKLIPSLRSRYPSYAAFGASRVEDIFQGAELRRATVLRANTFTSAVALGDGAGGFTLQPLPVEAQLAPVYASLADDYDGDGRVDLLLAGNFLGVPPVLGRYDASYGVLLRGDGAGGFTAVDMARSGLTITGQVRDLKRLRGAAGERLVAVARTDDALLVLRVEDAHRAARVAVAAPTRP